MHLGEPARGRLLLSVTAALGLAFVLRIPWFGVALGNDEGGLAYIAGAWHDGGPFPYGDYFIDRPPLLLLLFRLAALTGGTASVRTMGVVAVLALVVVTTLLARHIAGDRAAGWAAALAAALGSSAAIGSVFTPAELIAVLPSALSVLLVLKGVKGGRLRLPILAAAGALAVCALLVKQSFGDALLAGTACLAASALLDRSGGRTVAANAGAYLGGVLLPLLALEAWELVAAVPDGSMLYAVIGFRFEGLGALAASGGGLAGRFLERLLLPLVISGLVLILCWSAAGLRRLRAERVALWTIGVWGLGGLAGATAGGSYWPHYLIQLVPFAAVTASVALAAASRWPSRATAATLAACVIGGVTIGPAVAKPEGVPARAIGSYLNRNARAGDTAHVLYSQADVLYYSGLRDPFPYNWSLMVRALPEAQIELRAMLVSPSRPTWIVEWEPTRSYGLDRDGRTLRLLERSYREVGRVCGTPVLVRADVRRPLRAAPAAGCGQ